MSHNLFPESTDSGVLAVQDIVHEPSKFFLTSRTPAYHSLAAQKRFFFLLLNICQRALAICLLQKCKRMSVLGSPGWLQTHCGAKEDDLELLTSFLPPPKCWE